MANVQQTRQQKFATAVLMAQDQLKAAGLKKMAERLTVKGGESATFYRKHKGGVQDGVPSMYGGSSASLGGDFQKFVATIAQISSQDKISETDMLKTALDIKSPVIASMTNAILTEEDKKIMTAISGATGLRTGGDATKTIDHINNIKALIMAVRSAHVWAKCGLDQKKGVAIVMHEDDFTLLSTSDTFIHEDYAKAFGGGTGDVPLTFFGAEIIISENVPKGTLYVIPSYTFGFAEWENSIKTDCEFHATDGRTWHLQITKSYGVVPIEPTKITKFSVKP